MLLLSHISRILDHVCSWKYTQLPDSIGCSASRQRSERTVQERMFPPFLQQSMDDTAITATGTGSHELS